MSDAVALNEGGNEEELRDDAHDANANTSTVRLMLSEHELEGDGEISGVTERSDTAVPLWLVARTKQCAGMLLMYGPLPGVAFAFTMTNTALAWLVGVACLSVSLGTFSWVILSLICRCRRDPACCDLFIFILLGYLLQGVLIVTIVASVFLHVMWALYAFGDDDSLDESPKWNWTTLGLLDLHFVVCSCAIVIVHNYSQRLDSRPSIEGDAVGPCHLAPSFFIYLAIMCATTGCGIDLWAVVLWTCMTPKPAVAWMAPALLLAANVWIGSSACCMRISQRLSTISVAAQFELMANSSMKNDGAFARPTTTDAFHDDDGTDTETTISSEIV
mmetsp:Transcript_12964/g.23474  ORF Transcript_12964/g.23474 Transcript_12964/m.23474 type:complete len:331 (-) Transcript_12964:768-1760(-)